MVKKIQQVKIGSEMQCKNFCTALSALQYASALLVSRSCILACTASASNVCLDLVFEY